jgi:proteic killer suppression protein
MRIRNIAHKGLRRLYEEDSRKGLPADAVDKLGKMLAFLQDMEDADELRAVPTWKAHVFRIDEQENELVDLDYEDYH